MARELEVVPLCGCLLSLAVTALSVLLFGIPSVRCDVQAPPCQAERLMVRAEPGTAQEGVSGLRLVCHYEPSPNETLVRITWSCLHNNGLALIFQKDFLNSTTMQSVNYSFFGTWLQQKAPRHDETTLADVILDQHDVTREDACVYRCELTSDVSTVCSEANFTVLYGPGTSIHISSLHDSFRIREGETITLVCTASCFPSCRYRWTCSGCVARREATLTIPSIQQDQAGVYTCLVFNNVSRGRASVTIDVLYPAYIQDLHFAGGGRTLEVAEGDSVTISCQATGNPAPHTIQWSVSGPAKDNKTFEMRYRHDRSGVFMIPSASCHDNDEYTCTTTNGLDLDEKSVHLKVLCAPQPDDDACHHGNKTHVISLSQTLSNLTSCAVLAHPKPTVQWLRVIDNVSVDVSKGHGIIYDEPRARITTWISVRWDAERDYRGLYQVVIKNKKGSYVENFSVVCTEPPRHPHNLTVLNITATSFCLAWIAGFEGGGQQTFLVKYFKQSAGSVEWRDTDLIQSNQGDIVMMHCVDGLNSDTAYKVILSAENRFGQSQESSINITTMAEVTSRPLVLKSTLWIVIGAPLGTLLCLLLLLVTLFVWHRRRWSVPRQGTSTGVKQQAPLRVANENVRLSYLENSRQGSYVDATSLAVLGDDLAVGHDPNTAATESRRGSWFGLDRRLGVDDLSRRPSSTQSANIYLDILGEPAAAYANQGDQTSASYTNTHADVLTVTSTAEDEQSSTYDIVNPDNPANQYYIDMTEGSKCLADAVRSDSADYDGAWCSLPNFPITDARVRSYLPRRSTSEVSGLPTTGLSTPFVRIPTITVSEDVDMSMMASDSIQPLDCHSASQEDEEDEHIYDVIRDSDCEESV